MRGNAVIEDFFAIDAIAELDVEADIFRETLIGIKQDFTQAR